ncbi:hypothetical protein [Alteromonas sp. S015]|uniref:hypothetical protein n=1 Tax=Alteromonas sp. S015 TaxID=3117401 RepID=UPI002FE226BA
MMTKLKNKASPFYARIIKRSFSTSLVMAALTTLSACDAPNAEVAAQDEDANKTATNTVLQSSADERRETLTYLDNVEPIDTNNDV